MYCLRISCFTINLLAIFSVAFKVYIHKSQICYLKLPSSIVNIRISVLSDAFHYRLRTKFEPSTMNTSFFSGVSQKGLIPILHKTLVLVKKYFLLFLSIKNILATFNNRTLEYLTNIIE